MKEMSDKRSQNCAQSFAFVRMIAIPFPNQAARTLLFPSLTKRTSSSHEHMLRTEVPFPLKQQHVSNSGTCGSPSRQQTNSWHFVWRQRREQGMPHDGSSQPDDNGEKRGFTSWHASEAVVSLARLRRGQLYLWEILSLWIKLLLFCLLDSARYSESSPSASRGSRRGERERWAVT